MKTTNYKSAMLALLLLISAGGNAADTLQVEPPIKSVSVFGQQARVRRVADVAVKPGLNTIRIEGLPAGVRAGTVRAGITEGAANVMRLTESSHTEDASINKRAAALEAVIDSVEYFHRKRIASLIDVLEQQKRLLSLAIESGSEELTSQVKAGGFEVESWRSAYAFLGESLTELNDSLRVLNQLEDDFASLIEIKGKELTDLNSRQGNVSRNVTIDIDASIDGEVELYLEYLIDGATWRPVYDFRLVSADTVEVRYFGEISQRTGEDWSDVMLTLSTSRPSHASAPGNFQPRFVSAFSTVGVREATNSVVFHPLLLNEEGKIHVKGGRSNEATYIVDGIVIEDIVGGIGELNLIEGGFDAEFGGPMSGLSRFVTSSSSDFATSFRVEHAQTVLSGSESIRAPIAVYRLACELKLLARPTNRQVVFRIAEMKNTEDVPFLPGAVHLIALDDYIGSVSLTEPVFPNQEFEVPFGQDETVAIKRDILQEEHDRKGDEWKTKRRISIRVTNHGGEARRVRIEEALPVSQNKQVEVDIDKIKPEPIDRNLKGMAVWELTVPAGESRMITIAYEIEYPANSLLSGI